MLEGINKSNLNPNNYKGANVTPSQKMSTTEPTQVTVSQKQVDDTDTTLIDERGKNANE